jgi:hypothetical protein
VTLEEAGAGTLLRETAHVDGEGAPRLMEGMRRGTEDEYQALRAWLEQGKCVR